MNLNRFFAYSFVLHALMLIFAVIFLHTAKEIKRDDEFFARLVSPDEFPLREAPRSHAPPAASLPAIRPTPYRPPAVETQPSSEEGRGDVTYKKEGQLTAPPPQPLIPPRMGEQPGRGEQRRERIGPSLKDRLFDRGVINEMAKRDLEKEEKEIKDKTFTFDTKDFKFLIYNQRLKERIESIWSYPPDAAERGIYGDLVIRFTIKKNGRLGSVELVRTSGHKSLDDAAMKALRDGTPYWPLPDEWGMDAYTIEGHFVYSLYGYYVR
ncbi:MAG: TonB family protein [Nitrospirota bacterium]